MSGGNSSGGNWRDPNDARDPLSAERLEAADPDGFMRRREFLQRAALTGGLAMSMASVLSPDVIRPAIATPVGAPVRLAVASPDADSTSPTGPRTKPT